MQRFIQIIKWGGIPVGFLISAAGIASTARDIVTWGVAAWVWYLIGLSIVTASLISIIIGFWRENKSLKKEHETISDSELKLMEWRKDYRKSQSVEVSQIPATLKEMWILVDSATEEKKKKKPSKDKLMSVMADVLQMDKSDPIFQTANYTTEDRIRKMTQRMRARMGLKRQNVELEAQWRKRLSETMDDHGIGLELTQNSEYVILLKQLEKEGEPISATVIYHKTDQFLENLSALYSIKLFMHHGDTFKQLHLFPRDMREFLKHLEGNIDKVMRTLFTQVKAVLEDYSIGKEFKEQ
jgi:hypothetical protein